MATAQENKTATLALHAAVDVRAHHLHVLHASRLQCRRGCSSCCVDDLTVFEAEAALIRDRHALLLAHESPHVEGACAFLDDEGACRIYEERPYVCRTQGLPLRWLEENDDGAVELRDICPLNENGEPIEALETEACWTIGPFEEQLARIQLATSGDLQRVRLRDLFVAE